MDKKQICAEMDRVRSDYRQLLARKRAARA